MSLWKIDWAVPDRETHRESGYVIAIPPRTSVAEHRLHMPPNKQAALYRCKVFRGKIYQNHILKLPTSPCGK